MAQPVPYDKTQDFTEYAIANPQAPFPPAALDSELVNVDTNLTDLNRNIALLQRDDGAILNGAVHKDAFSAESLALIEATWVPRGFWATSTAYVLGDLVDNAGFSYVCSVAHTSGTFGVDYAAGKWLRLFNSATDTTPAVVFREHKMTATAGQTVFTLPDSLAYMMGISGLSVYMDGVRLVPSEDWTETTVLSFTLTSAASRGQEVVALVAQTVSANTSANQIYYTQQGTGALARSVSEKIYEMVSVNDFGAVGDGVTDDRAAFSATETVGYKTYIPKPPVGYIFSSPLALTIPVEIDPDATWDQITNGGNLTFTNNSPFQSSTPPANIHRLGGRVFVGDAADGFSGLNAAADEAGSWYGTDSAAYYLQRDATLVCVSPSGRVAIAAAARSSDNNINPAWTSTIAVGAHVVNDMVAGGGFSAGNAWGFIAELQAEPGCNVTHGIEIGAKNKKGSDANTDPYLTNAGVTGVWLAGGGDNRFGGSATGPADSGIVILKNQQSGLAGGGWKSGIVIKSDAIDGVTGTASDPGRGDAIRLGRGQKISWFEPTSGNAAFSIVGTCNADTYAVTIEGNDGGGANPTVEFFSPLGMFAKIRGAAVSSADYVVLQSALGAARINVEGPSIDADIFLSPKGTGTVRFGTWTSNADAAVNGYVTIKDVGGVTRKLATIA